MICSFGVPHHTFKLRPAMLIVNLSVPSWILHRPVMTIVSVQYAGTAKCCFITKHNKIEEIRNLICSPHAERNPVPSIIFV